MHVINCCHLHVHVYVKIVINGNLLGEALSDELRLYGDTTGGLTIFKVK